jgi:hypothetical protein
MLRNLRNRRLVELVPLCDCEEFVIDIHAVFLGLACVSEIGGPAVRSCSPHRTGTYRCPYGSRGRCGHFPGSCYFERARADCEHWSVTTLFGHCVLCGLVRSEWCCCCECEAPAQRKWSHRAGGKAALTHSMPS